MAFVPAPGAHYFLVAVHSDKVLEVKDASHDNGAILQQADPKPYLESFHQQFAFNPNRDRVYVLRARHSQKVIDIEAASHEDAAKVHQWDWHGVDHERFRVVDAGDGTFYLEAVHSGKVLEIYGEEKGAGKQVRQYHNHYNGKNLHQRFRPVLAEEGFAPAVLPGFTNPSQMTRDATLAIAGLVPEVGGAVKGLVGFFWPDQGPAMIWNQVMQYIEAYVESKLEQARITALRDTVAGAQTNLREFARLSPGTEKASKLTATITAINQVDRPFLNASAPEKTLSYLITIGTMKLTLLQEQARNYAAVAKIEKDDNKQAHLEFLADGIAEYTRAAKYFRDQALNARVAQIGSDFDVIEGHTPDHETFWNDVILKDGGDGSRICTRTAHDGGAVAAAKTHLRNVREKSVRAQYGAQLDAVLAPARLWAAFHPDATHPVPSHTIRASIGPYGTVTTPIDMAAGKEIAKIEVWGGDHWVHGLRVTNRAGASNMVGIERGTRSELALAAGEFVAGVYGSSWHDLRSLFLETTFGRRLGAGDVESGARFQADLPPELNAHLGGITASGGRDDVSSIEFHWDYVLQGDFPPPKAIRGDAPPLWSPPPALSA